MFYIQTEQVIIQQPATRAIHPDIHMSHPDFLKGYAIGLRNGLHPELPQDEPLTDEEIVTIVRECVTDEPDTLPYVLGNLIGSIIASCH